MNNHAGTCLCLGAVWAPREMKPSPRVVSGLTAVWSWLGCGSALKASSVGCSFPLFFVVVSWCFQYSVSIVFYGAMS